MPDETAPLGSRLLREWRAARGMTQPQAADLLELNFVQVSRFERGARPGRDNAVKIEQRTDGAVPVVSWTMEDRVSRRAG